MPFITKPRTHAESVVFKQAHALRPQAVIEPGMAYGSASRSCSRYQFDEYAMPYDGDFALDKPVLAALLPTLVQTDPETAVLLVASTQTLPDKPMTPEQANASFNAWYGPLKDSLIGPGNIAGNIHGVVESSLRAYWARHAAQGFARLRAGGAQSIRLSPNITIYAHRIGANGKLRRGAQIRVKVSNLPVQVLHQIPTAAFGGRATQSFASMRSSAHDMRRLQALADGVADSRAQSSMLLRAAGSKVGGGILAFGPSAAFDFYDSTSRTADGLAVDWRGFAVRSAKSQSGNVLGVAAGTGTAVAVGMMAARGLLLLTPFGWPVFALSLVAGVAVQAAWSRYGGDEAAGNAAASALGVKR